MVRAAKPGRHRFRADGGSIPEPRRCVKKQGGTLNWRFIGAAALALSAFIVGHRYAAALYSADIAALREDYATRASVLEEKYRAKEQENARAVVAAWEERDRALASATDLSDELSRVRIEADCTRRELSRTRGDSCDAVRAELSTCTSLFERSVEFLARDSQLAERIAIERDSIIHMR